MKILITGGAGFIGSHIADLLISKNHRVIIIDNLSTGKIENLNPRARFYKTDLCDENKIKEIFKKEMPEVVYHLAAQINVRKSLENPVKDAEINLINTLKLLQICVENKIKHFIFSSTGGALYGDTKDLPTKENHETKPISGYGCAKLSVEKYLHFYRKVYGLKYTVLRYSNVYGPRQNSEGEAGIIAIFFNNLKNNQTPKIFGGIQTRDFVYVKDVANANFLALEGPGGIYNVSTAKETDIIEIFSQVNKYFKGKFQAKYEELKKGEQLKSCLSWDKIYKILNWSPQTTLEEGLNQTYLWFMNQKQHL